MMKTKQIPLLLVLWLFFSAFYPCFVFAASEVYQHYDTNSLPALTGNLINDVYYDRESDRVFIATGYFYEPIGSTWKNDSEKYSRGINILDRRSNKVHSYTTENANIPTNCYMSIVYHDGLIIAGSYYCGIIVINENTNSVTVFDISTNPALKERFRTGNYLGVTAPIGDLHYENGKIYFAYGDESYPGVCGGVLDLSTSSIMHYTYYSLKYRRKPIKIFVSSDKVFFADREISVFDKFSGQILKNREDKPDLNSPDWSPDPRFIAYDELTDQLFVGDISGQRFTNHFGLRIYDGELNYLGHWDASSSSAVSMLENNVTALELDRNNRLLYIAHVRHDYPVGTSATIGNFQTIDLENIVVRNNYVSINEMALDNYLPTPQHLLPAWHYAWFDWANIINSFHFDGNGTIFVGQTATHHQFGGNGGGLGIILKDDSDGDGISDDQDICPGGDDSIDSDMDGVPNYCDPCPNDGENDADGDGVCGDLDTCPGGDDSQNIDGDSLPDFCDVCPNDIENDADGDGVCETFDNCPTIANTNQADNDLDQIGDACDNDDDNDNIQDSDDNCPLISNSDQSDIDSDGAGDECDADDDNDGVIDADDQCLFTSLGAIVDNLGCSLAEICPCENEWKNHGAYVKCIAFASEKFLLDGLITESMKDLIVSNAAQSICGNKK